LRELEAGIGIALIGQIIGHAGKGIDGVDMRAEFLGHEAANGEILIVALSQLTAFCIWVGWLCQDCGG
jgi:hypothetical protein